MLQFNETKNLRSRLNLMRAKNWRKLKWRLVLVLSPGAQRQKTYPEPYTKRQKDHVTNPQHFDFTKI